MSSGNVFGDAGQFHEPAASPTFDLRPLSTGEVLDRTFHLYRSRFALFAGVALLPAAASTMMSAVRLLYTAHQQTHVHTGAALVQVQIITGVLEIVSLVITIVLYGITEAATIWAVSAVYLGDAASIRAAYGVAFRNWFRYTLVKLRQVWAGMWLPMVFFIAAIVAGVVGRKHGMSLTVLVMVMIVLGFLSLLYGLWAYLRISLAVPAAVVESLKVRAAVRRSAVLLTSRKIRIFMLLLLVLALYFVVGMIESPLLIVAVRSRGAQAFVTYAINLVVSFIAGTLLGPVSAIGVCLFYFDERVRREGFDIEWMMKKLSSAATAGQGLSPQAQENSAEPA
jgi:hypothetical protein